MLHVLIIHMENHVSEPASGEVGARRQSSTVRALRNLMFFFRCWRGMLQAHTRSG